MNFEIQLGEKFAIIAFRGVSREDGLSDPVFLGKSTWALFASPIDVEKYWKGWLGSLWAEDISHSNFILVSKRRSKSPEVLNSENEALKQNVNISFWALLLLGLPEYESAHLLSGANDSGVASLRSHSELQDFRRTHGLPELAVTSNVLQKINSVVTGLEAIYRTQKLYDRVQRGMDTFVKGMHEDNPQDRILHFVRAIEALIKPEIAKTKRQFKHRSQTFILPGKQVPSVLEEIYQIRSHVEHMHSWEIPLLAHPAREREAIAFRRTRQAEELARETYLRICTSKKHREVFQTDSEIDSFWSLQDHIRKGIWGEGLDLISVA